MNIHNSLVDNYNKFQKNKVEFKKNALLNLPCNEDEKVKNLYQQINKLKNIQQIKQLEKYNDLDKFIDKDKLKESIITSIQIIKPNQNQIITDFTLLNQNYEPLLHKYWGNRNNVPYKNILKNEDYTKIPLNNAKKEDLIVHKVTDADKIGLLDEYNELNKILERHNTELTIIYSSSKEAEYKEKFKYYNASQSRIKYDPSDFKKLKKDKIKFYQDEQKKLETDKKKIDDLIEAALHNGSLTNEEINEINKIDNDNKDNIDDIDNIDNDENTIKKILNDDELEINNKDDKNSDMEVIELEPIKKDTRDRYKKNNIETKTERIVAEDIKEKYRLRQKKI